MAEKTDVIVVRHASAARAFHTGLIADTQRLRASLSALTDHLNVVRHKKSAPARKLAAVEAAWVQLRSIEKLTDAWRETYRDLRRSLQRVRLHMRHASQLQRVVRPSKPSDCGHTARD